MTNFVARFLSDIASIAGLIDIQVIEKIVDELTALKKRGGRLFFLGVGGSAANCSHAVNDFRKLCGIETYAPTDNISELTARTNDEGWDTVFSSWLMTSQFNEDDAVFVLSVGGGDKANNVSPNIVSALEKSKRRGLKIFGIVGRSGGYTKKVGDHVLLIPTVNADCITPHAESFQSIILHCIVSHPKLKCHATKWESLTQNV